jgi:peptidoglycan/LPS O-acetylase OafA/YrhL
MTTEIQPNLEPTLGHMRERDHYIDRLRSVMIALVILHHTAITYGASGGWFYHELSPSSTLSSVILTLFCATNQAYFMGILFLLAGYFTPGSLERKGYASFLTDRFLRLGLPLLAFGLILGPLTVATVTAAEGKGFWSTFVWLWNHREFINGPLWFVQALLIFSLPIAPGAHGSAPGLPAPNVYLGPSPVMAGGS